MLSNLVRTLSKNRTTLVKVSSFRQQSTDYSQQCDGFVVEPKNQILWMRFDRPDKLNAITKAMYRKMADTFRQANEDDSIKALVLTGTGDYYSSGNDLSTLMKAIQDPEGPRAGLTKARDLLYDFVDSLVHLEKVLIAAVNGPAVGIPVTTLPLCDFVVASDKATFQSPFTALGQCAEACSSVTLPRIMGASRANELLLLNMKWDAKKAQRYGLVSEVIPNEVFHEQLEKLLYGKQGFVDSCYPGALKVGKSLVRNADFKRQLVEANKRECDAILECWLSEETSDAIQKFFSRSKK